MIAGLLAGLYVFGWVVAAILATRNWFERFGVELEGAAWGMFLALIWPLLLPAYAIKWAASRGLVKA